MNPFGQARAFLLLALVGACPSLFGKDYIIEMVFFANQQERIANSVYISTRPVTPALQDAVLLNENAATYGFTLLPPEALTLTKQAAALEESGRYRTLRHVAWRQPGLAGKDARAVRIYAGENYKNEFGGRRPTNTNDPIPDPPPHEKTRTSPDKATAISTLVELDGTITVVLGRYLHVYTDLVYRRPYVTDSLPRRHALAEFAVKTHRKMRSKKLHYLDHPLLGILVTIRPVEESGQTTEAG